MKIQEKRVVLGFTHGQTPIPLNGRHLQDAEKACLIVYGPKTGREQKEKIIDHYMVRDIVDTIIAMIETGIEGRTREAEAKAPWAKLPNKEKIKAVKTAIIKENYFPGIAYDDLNICVEIARKNFPDTAKQLVKRKKKIKPVNVFMDSTISGLITPHLKAYKHREFKILPLGRTALLKGKKNTGILITSDRKIIDRLGKTYAGRVQQTQDSKVPMDDLPFVVFIEQKRQQLAAVEIEETDISDEAFTTLDRRAARRIGRTKAARSATKAFGNAAKLNKALMRGVVFDHLRRIVHWNGDVRRLVLGVTISADGRLVPHERLSLLNEYTSFVDPTKAPVRMGTPTRQAFAAANDGDEYTAPKRLIIIPTSEEYLRGDMVAGGDDVVGNFLQEERRIRKGKGRRLDGSHRPSYTMRR